MSHALLVDLGCFGSFERQSCQSGLSSEGKLIKDCGQNTQNENLWNALMEKGE